MANSRPTNPSSPNLTRRTLLLTGLAAGGLAVGAGTAHAAPFDPEIPRPSGVGGAEGAHDPVDLQRIVVDPAHARVGAASARRFHGLGRCGGRDGCNYRQCCDGGPHGATSGSAR